MRLSRVHVGIFVVSAVCSGCGDDIRTTEGIWDLDVPPGFPMPQVPDDNPITSQKAELGRYLFYDARLSGNGTQSCAECHLQERAFSDGRTVATGSTGQEHPRNASSLTNVAYNATLTWANPSLTQLEQQLLVPIFGENPVELGASEHAEEILQRLEEDPLYHPLFTEAFPDAQNPIRWDNIVRALATFVRTMISGNAPFDRFVYHDEKLALSSAAQRGLALFFSERLECHHCHGGFNFTESSIHADSAFGAARFSNTGLYNIDETGAYPANNTGVFEITGHPSDMGRFRAPTLRNVEVTAPYMHDGSIATLEAVIRFYEAGGRLVTDGPYAGDGRANPFKSGFITGFVLSDQERNDLIAFLESLTDEGFLEDPRLANPFLSNSRE